MPSLQSTSMSTSKLKYVRVPTSTKRNKLQDVCVWFKEKKGKVEGVDEGGRETKLNWHLREGWTVSVGEGQKKGFQA